MPIFSLSPSVEVKESDLTLIVPAVATSIGGFSGVFQWGPVEEVTIVDSEKTLADIFSVPDADTVRDFLTAANFLSYSNHLKLVRVVGSLAKNAYSGGAVAPTIKNYEDYLGKVSGLATVNWVAKYPGALGNSLKVSFADADSFEAWDYRSLFGSAVTVNKTGATTNADATVTVASTANLAVGMSVTGTGIPAAAKILSITNATTFELSANATATGASVALVFTSYTGAPGTSSYVASKGGSNDEIHLVVIDEDGLWSGQAGTVLERYVGLSKSNVAKDFSGATSYYADVLNRNSRYVWFGGTHPTGGTNWGGAATVTFTTLSAAVAVSLSGGVSDNGDTVTPANRIAGYVPFIRAEEVDVNFIIAPGLESQGDQEVICDYIIENIANVRKDCVAFISPPMEAVVNNKGNELQAILNFRGVLNSSSYSVLDSGWKMQYSRYNDQMVWVPLSADIAGLCAHTDQVADPWYSPAGFNRGFIKNVIKLAYNPGSKAERDTLYVNNVNPVTSMPGEGVVLFGDKTMQAKPSAFDRINVRRLFIVLEKAISTAAKYQLFEFNDTFTRNRFVGMTEPYLREVKGRRGVTDFRVVCDASNNTPEIIDSNGFVADIYIKPARSINFIQLNFIATPTGVSFEEIA
jgi:hypothetical protein